MGNTHKTWTAFYTNVPAEIHPFTSTEIFAGQQTQTHTTHKITMRYLDGIDTTIRVLYGTRKFLVNGVINEDERRISLVLVCLEDFS